MLDTKSLKISSILRSYTSHLLARWRVLQVAKCFMPTSCFVILLDITKYFHCMAAKVKFLPTLCRILLFCIAIECHDVYLDNGFSIYVLSFECSVFRVQSIFLTSDVGLQILDEMPVFYNLNAVEKREVLIVILQIVRNLDDASLVKAWQLSIARTRLFFKLMEECLILFEVAYC